MNQHLHRRAVEKEHRDCHEDGPTQQEAELVEPDDSILGRHTSILLQSDVIVEDAVHVDNSLLIVDPTYVVDDAPVEEW